MDVEQKNSDWYQIILHEMSHLFCLTREIAGDNFTARYLEGAIAENPKNSYLYSSKYEPSGMLFCGICGSPYRRCTWKRNGKPCIVWRCQNRLKNRTRYCTDSPTIEESTLHQALTKAINGMLHQQEYLLKPFDKTEVSERCQTLAVQQKQADSDIVDLIMQYADHQNWDGDSERFRSLVEKRRKLPPVIHSDCFRLPYQLETYNDHMACHVLERVTVLDANRLRVTFRGSVPVEQTFS